MELANKWSPQRLGKVRRLVRNLYDVVDELNKEFTNEGRKFTPDGHLVGTLGELIAAYAFGLDLLPVGTPRHDAKALDGKLVQVKLTGGDRGIGLNSKPEYLIVLQLKNGSDFNLVYNGPGAPVWEKRGRRQKNGQWRISLRTLEELDIRARTRVPQIRGFP